jgi:hypothetical protein
VDAILAQLARNKRKDVITFLADVENPAANPKYQAIIDHLKSLGHFQFAQEFEAARERRAKQPEG